MLSGCSETNQIEDLEGQYYFDECVYLNLLSSSTKDYMTEQYKDSSYIRFYEDKIVHHGTNLDYETYTEVEYKKVEVTKDLDFVINYESEVFDIFTSRYDLYVDGEHIGITLFFDQNSMFVGETGMIGGNNDIFTIWTIFKVDKKDVVHSNTEIWEYLLNQEFHTDNGWAGEGMYFRELDGKMFCDYMLFGSGLPVVGLISLEVNFDEEGNLVSTLHLPEYLYNDKDSWHNQYDFEGAIFTVVDGAIHWDDRVFEKSDHLLWQMHQDYWEQQLEEHGIE